MAAMRTRTRIGATNTTPGLGQSPASGGKRIAVGKVGNIGHEKYLWILVILEVLAMGALRQAFRRHHGG